MSTAEITAESINAAPIVVAAIAADHIGGSIPADRLTVNLDHRAEDD